MKDIFRRFCISLLLIFFLLSPLSIEIVNSISAVPLFTVNVNPPNAGSLAEYRIYGSFSEYGDNIAVLKVDFKDPTTFSESEADPEYVIVNNQPVKSIYFRKVEDDGRIEATILLANLIKKGDSIEIVFKKEAGLINPIVPATCYKVRVTLLNQNNIEIGYILSNNYTIVTSTIQDLNINVNPPVTGIQASYRISFVTGVRGALSAGRDAINVKFPEGIKFPLYISKNNILVNNTEPSAVYRSIDEPYVFRIYTTFDIKSNSPLSIVFLDEFGIINPKESGFKIIRVATTAEPDWVESEPYEIFEPEIQNLSVSLAPDSVALQPGLNLNFTTSPVGFVNKGDKIYVEFSQDFLLPVNVQSDHVFVNGHNTEAFTSGNRIEVILPQNVLPLSQVEVKILKEAGIINPSSPGDYTVNVWTDSDSFRSSFNVIIKPSTLTEVKLEAEYSGLNTINEFKIYFKTGPVYTLVKDIDRIKINFDENFVFPETVSQNLITVSDKVSTNVVKEGNSIFIITPLDISPNTLVEVLIPNSFGIKNPPNLGEYGVKVSTSKEPTEVESNKIKVTPLPVVEFTVNPAFPDGINGFYKTNPEIMLSTSNGVKVFYKIDNEEFKEFTQAFKVSEGAHAVYAYAVDSGGNKGDIFKREFNIDTTPPEVKFDNLNSNPVFKESPGKLSGTVSELCTLKINEVILELSRDNLNFTAELNVYEGMPIAIYVRDLAGNAKTMLLSAHIDSTPPTITYLNMSANLQSADGGTRTIETAESSYTIQMKLSEKGKVYINNSEVSAIGENFTYYANLTDGENLFTVKAVDLAGNETLQTLVIKKVNEKKIVLQIGATTAILGGNTLELEAAPFIENNFTLVPLRFISEAFGATVQWNEALKVITIIYNGKSIILQVGSTIAVVEGSTAKLDVAPKIVNGRTFVPIRFISETFGAEVLWDGTTKTITIKIML